MSEVGRVTYLITASGVGGAEVQVRELAMAMKSRGWQTNAISMLPLGEVFADLPDAGIPTATLGMRRSVPDPRVMRQLRSLLQRHDTQILHAHMVHACLLARLVRLVYPKPKVISTMHSQNQGSRWRNVAYRLTDRLGACSTTVSSVAREDALRGHMAPPSRLKVVPNGIDTARYAPDPEVRRQTRESLGISDEFLWLATGRLVEAKDYPNMIAAMARVVQDQDVPVRLVIAGHDMGGLEASLRAQLAVDGITPNVDFLGLRRDVSDLMQAADGFVMSSAWEGLPMVLLEAGASGLPAVVTEVGGSRDAVLDGRTCYVVAKADPDALADAMTRLMRLPDVDRRAMGDAARAHTVQTYDMESTADRWDAIYRQLLGVGTSR